MKKICLLVAILSMCIVLTSPANAAIIDVNCAADGDGAIVMDPVDATHDFSWTPTGLEGGIETYTLTMDGAQYSAPAHVEGDFTANSELDPIVWIIEDVDNATGFTWTGYQFNIFMTKPFTITGVVAPIGWTYTTPTVSSGQTWPHSTVTGWMGSVTYTAGSGYEIENSETGEFGLRVKFDGSVAFCTEQIPTPEPMTIAMLGLGGLLIRRKK